MSHAHKADKLLIKPAAGARPAPPCHPDKSAPKHAKRPVPRRVTSSTATQRVSQSPVIGRSSVCGTLFGWIRAMSSAPTGTTPFGDSPTAPPALVHPRRDSNSPANRGFRRPGTAPGQQRIARVARFLSSSLLEIDGTLGGEFTRTRDAELAGDRERFERGEFRCVGGRDRDEPRGDGRWRDSFPLFVVVIPTVLVHLFEDFSPLPQTPAVGVGVSFPIGRIPIDPEHRPSLPGTHAARSVA